MAIRFNPLTGNFDFTGSGGGGGDSYIDGEVATYADLPLDGTAALNSAWLVRTASGVWPVTRKQAGIYIRTATLGSNRDSDYTYAGTLPDVFSDSQFLLYDNGDSTKNLAFQLSSIATGTTRTLTVPNSSGEISLVGHTHIASDIVFGQFNNDRIDWNSPNAIGSNVPQDGTFTTLTANTALVLKDGTGNETATFDAQGNLTANRTYDLPDASGVLALTSQISKTLQVFVATDSQPTATAFMTLDTRNSISVLDADDTSTESAVFVGILPEAASLGSGLIVSLRWMATTAISGDVRWSVAWEKSNTDLDSDSFDTAAAATATTNGTSGIVTVTNITCTTIDSLAAGDLFRLRVQRIGGDGADTMTGDAELVAVEVRSAA